MKNTGSRASALAATWTLAIIAASLSCRDVPFRGDYRDRLSWVVSVIAPDTVGVGDSFEVEMRTSGNNGCWRKGHDQVTRPTPLEVRIVPYDREYIGTGFCTQDVPTFHHIVSLTASAKGSIEVFVTHRPRATSGADSTGVTQLRVYAR